MKSFLLHRWPALCAGIASFGILTPLLSFGLLSVLGCLVAAITAAYIAQKLWNHHGQITHPGMYSLCLFAALSYGRLLDNVVNSKLQQALLSATVMGGMLLLAVILWLGNNWNWAGWGLLKLERNKNGRIILTKFLAVFAYFLFLPLLLYKFFSSPTTIAYSFSLLFWIITAYIIVATRTIWGKPFSLGLLGMLVLPNSQYVSLIGNLVEGRLHNTLAHTLFFGLYLILIAGFLADAATKSRSGRDEFIIAS